MEENTALFQLNFPARGSKGECSVRADSRDRLILSGQLDSRYLPCPHRVGRFEKRVRLGPGDGLIGRRYDIYLLDDFRENALREGHRCRNLQSPANETCRDLNFRFHGWLVLHKPSHFTAETGYIETREKFFCIGILAL